MSESVETPWPSCLGRNSDIIEIFDRLKSHTEFRKPFVIASKQLTYGQLFDHVPRLGSLYEELGLTFGDRVVIASDVDTATCTIFLSLLRCGITAVILNPASSEREIRLALKTVEPKAVFLDRSIMDGNSILDLAANFVEISFGLSNGSAEISNEKANALSFPASLADFAPKIDLPNHVPDSLVAYILFTSGTTSHPKGVEITHRALFAQTDTFLRQFGFDAESRILNLFPLHHTDGLTQGVVVMLAAGGCLVRPFRFSIGRLPQLFDSIFIYRITHFVAPPTLLSMALALGEERPSIFKTVDFQFVISSASALSEHLWQKFEEWFDTTIVNVYGLTEITSVALYCGPNDATRKFGTIGKPVDCMAKIVDENDDEVQIGSTGEMLLQGEHLMKGYFQLPNETAKVMRNGWFHTGDLAFCDEDGFFHIVGRKKNLIIRGGFNINPEEINTILEEIPGVLEAVTVGIPDETFGERVVSCVVPKPGETLTQNALARYFMQHASPELSPDEINVMADLPRGPAGKVALEALKNELEKNEFDSAANNNPLRLNRRSE